MKSNAETHQALYVGLDVHKAQTVLATLEDHREGTPETHGSGTTSQHALERVIRRIAEASGCGFLIARLFERLSL